MLNLIFSLNTLWWLILFLYIPACFALIIIVLLQKGKGQGLAGAFGMGGGMDTIFGPRSSKSLPQKITYAGAAVFMTLALVMSILSGKVGKAPAPELIETPVQASLDALFDPNAPAAVMAGEGEGAAPVEGAGEGITAVQITSDQPSAAPAEVPAADAAVTPAPAEAPAVDAPVTDASAEVPAVDAPVTEVPAEAPVAAPPAETPAQ